MGVQVLAKVNSTPATLRLRSAQGNSPDPGIDRQPQPPSIHSAIHCHPPFLGRPTAKVVQAGVASRNTPAFSRTAVRGSFGIQPLMTAHLQPDYRLIAGKPASWFVLHTFTQLPRGTKPRIGPSNSRQIKRSRIERHDPEKPDAGTPTRAKSTPPAQRRIQATQACAERLACCRARCRCHARQTPAA